MGHQGTDDRRGRALRDSLVVFWVVLWVAVAVMTGYQVWSLSGVSTAVTASARATDQAGEGLQQVSELPLVPEDLRDLGDSVRAAADEIQRAAVDLRADVRRLSVLLGLSVAVIPVVPVLVWFLPGRIRRQRELRTLRETLRRSGRTRELDAYLALRAFTDLSYGELTGLTDDPARDLLAGRHERLATAQLRRLGLSTDEGPDDHRG